MEFVYISLGILIIVGGYFLFYRNKLKNRPNLSSESANPINKLTFQESLDLEKFNDELISYNLYKSDQALSHIFRLNTSDGVKLVESVKLVKESNSIVWELSKEGKKLLKTGKVEWVTHNETGKLLPVVKNSKGSKFKELIKGSKGGKLGRAAKLTNVVINAAHIISGADLSKKLDSVNNKLDYLIEARKIDKLSKLESLYYELKELISSPNVADRRQKILKIHDQIRLIRITWRNELEHHLDNIKNPKSRSFFQKLFSIDKNTDENLFKEITRFEDEMKLIDYCFALDFAICGAVNQDFDALYIELERLRTTAEKLEAKRNYFTGKFPEFSLERHINYLSTISDKYENYFSQELLDKDSKEEIK